jgi:DNA gyrase inhibitor GyrI/AraC-like DNA-binding protein
MQETRTVHEQAVRKISRYIDDHLSEPLDMEELARMSGLSFFHFRRVFKTVTGECIAGYIQRLRLEQIAGLLISTNLTLDQLLCQTNYQTKFSLAKAFKKHFGISTSDYRKSYKQSPVTYEEVSTMPEIRFVANTTVLYVEVGDTYKNRYLFREKWNQMVRYSEQNKLDGAFGTFLSLSLDDPLITQRDKCRFYLGLTVPSRTEPESDYGILTIPFARYAVFRHIGSYEKLPMLYQAIYENWMPRSNYRPKGTFSFEMYLNSPISTNESDLITEIYIPIEKH